MPGPHLEVKWTGRVKTAETLENLDPNCPQSGRPEAAPGGLRLSIERSTERRYAAIRFRNAGLSQIRA